MLAANNIWLDAVGDGEDENMCFLRTRRGRCRLPLSYRILLKKERAGKRRRITRCTFALCCLLYLLSGGHGASCCSSLCAMPLLPSSYPDFVLCLLDASFAYYSIIPWSLLPAVEGKDRTGGACLLSPTTYSVSSAGRFGHYLY